MTRRDLKKKEKDNVRMQSWTVGWEKNGKCDERKVKTIGLSVVKPKTRMVGSCWKMLEIENRITRWKRDRRGARFQYTRTVYLKMIRLYVSYRDTDAPMKLQFYRIVSKKSECRLVNVPRFATTQCTNLPRSTGRMALLVVTLVFALISPDDRV